ncbi:MAG: sugar ABC transporter substrate-binding protein [Anaerolineae bacterium]|nr:sugar ABC transporter substrate-binding protein [Anaerolineae bacterium]
MPPTTTPPTATPQPEPVTITWAFWGDPWEVEINEQVIEVFERDHPDIKIETFHRSWNDYFKEVRSKLDKGEQVADVLFWSQAPIDVPKGYFMNLAPLMKAEGYDLDDFYQGLLTQYRLTDDAIYGLPRDSDTKVIFYNKRVFNRANVDFPESGWSWDDLRETSLAIQEAGVIDYSFAYEVNNWWMIWMWQNNNPVFDDKLFPSRSFLGEPSAGEAVQFLADLTNEDQVTPPYEVLKSSEELARLFQEEKVAMVFGNHALVPAFSQIDNFEWDVVGLPRKERAANLAAGAGYFIADSTEHPDEAWTFLKFLGSPKGQAIFTEAGVAVPSRRSVAESEIFMKPRASYDIHIFLEEVEIGEADPAFPGANEIVNLLNEEVLVPVWQGDQPAAEALQDALPEIERIIHENQPPQQ